MIKLLTFTNNKDNFLEFNFNKPDIKYNEDFNWVQISSEKQRLTFSENGFIAFDTNIEYRMLDIQWISLCQKTIQELFFKNQVSLIIYTNSDNPIMCLNGNKICLRKRQKNFAIFEIDDKLVYLYNLHFMTLARNA